MSRDYQGEYNSLYKEYLEYTETVDESIKDKADMDKFYDEYILKYQSKRDYVVDAMNKIVSDAKAEGVKIKERPIKYYKIKRSESMDELELEERASFDSQKEAQKYYDDCKKEYEKQLNLKKTLIKQITAVEEQYKKVEKEMSDILSEMEKTVSMAKADGFTIKRSEDNDNLEYRALNTQKDYQKAIDELWDEIDDLLGEGKKYLDKIDMIRAKISPIEDQAKKLRKEAESKGFKIKSKSMANDKYYIQIVRSKEESSDIELRALETQEDYQKAIDKLRNEANKYNKLANDCEKDTNDYIKKKSIERNMYLKKVEEILDEIFDIKDEAKKKGFNIKNTRSSYNRDDLETRKKEIVANLTNFEERKNAVLDNLEARALKTQEDYQKEYDKCWRQLASLARDWIDSYEQYKEEIKGYKKNGDKVAVNDLTKQMKKEEQEYHKEAAKVNDKIKTIVAAAKKLDYKLKERNVIDFF